MQGGLAVGMVTTQLDTPAPGPADVVGGIIITAASLVAASVYIYELTQASNMPHIVYSKSPGKSDPHGESGRIEDKIQKQLDQLNKQLKNATGRTKKKIRQKIKNLQKDAA